jgi:uncharacterized membrane protein YeaQ/YmgE (transglycosylase-associated protein family)
LLLGGRRTSIITIGLLLLDRRLAGLLVKGYGFGVYIVVGIIGVVLAGWLLPLAGFVLIGGIVAEIINAVIGAVILLVVIGFFKKKLRPTSGTEAAA